MEISSLLGLPSALAVDDGQQSAAGLMVFLHVPPSTVLCPRGGTAGSRFPSRETRTVSDLPCGGQHLILKLRVRKWVCSCVSCSQRVFAEPFPGSVRKYARMTRRLINVLQSRGTTTNGADGAGVSSLLAMPPRQKHSSGECLSFRFQKRVQFALRASTRGLGRRDHTTGRSEWISNIGGEPHSSQSVRWSRAPPGSKSTPKSRSFRLIVGRSSAPPWMQVLLRPNSWWIASMCTKTLPKRWKNALATTSVCSKKRHSNWLERRFLPHRPLDRSPLQRHASAALPNVFVARSRSGSGRALDPEKKPSPRCSGWEAERCSEYWSRNNLPLDTEGTGLIISLIPLCLL